MEYIQNNNPRDTEHSMWKKQQRRRHKKRTPWWSEDIKNVIQIKKNTFKKWIKSKTREDYDSYKIARNNTKQKSKKLKRNHGRSTKKNL
jgi:hypothetical protein